jgi:hypothetical protein
MDHALRPALPERHLERLEHVVRPQLRRHRPAHDLAAEHVTIARYRNPAQVPDVGRIGHPEPIPCVGPEPRLGELEVDPRRPVGSRSSNSAGKRRSKFNSGRECAGETGEGMRVKVSPGQGRSGSAGTESCERPGNVAFEA